MVALRKPEAERTGEERDRPQYRSARQPASAGEQAAESERLQQSLGNRGTRNALEGGRAQRAAASREAVWYLVDDAAAELKPGQARRGEYLRALERVVYHTAEHGLAPLGRTARDCPYLRAMFRFYGRRDAAEVSAALRRYAPETAWAGSAAESAWMVGLRVRDSVRVWASTGRIARVPEWSGERGDIAAAQIRSGLGEPLPGGVRGRMEQAFGEGFGGVRIHRDEPAAEFAQEQKARAVTTGQDVYFARDQFRPGTVVGDAILAHELAHVVQQRGGGAAGGEIVDRSASPEYEQDADGAARAAVHSIWTKTLGATAQVMRRASVSLRAGLSIQRCGSPAKTPSAPAAPGPLTFASSNFTPSGGGPVLINDLPANVPPAVDVRATRYFCEGDVTASGGTDAEAADWQAGFLQTVTASRLAFDYQDSANAHLFFLVFRLAGPTRDGLPGGTPPWYHPSSTLTFATTNSTLHPSMNDAPGVQPPWTITGTTGTVAHLASSSGKDQFGSWLVVRQMSTGNISYLNWDTWEIDWAANYNATAKTGAPTGAGATITGQGAGQGAVTPVLVDPVANTSTIVEVVP